MPAVESAVRSRLDTFPETAAILKGGDGILRVYPLKLPSQVVLPAVEYMIVSRDSDLNHSGNPSLLWSRFQFGLWANSYADMINLAGAVMNAFHGYRGTITGVRFDQGKLLTEHDDYDDEVAKWRRVADYGFWYAL
jgi:hypothetical protein